MKLLLDACVGSRAKIELEEAAHDVDWVGDWPSDPGDEEVLAWAFRQDRILVTLDKDFGELAVTHEKPHVGIIRLVGFSARAQAKVCLSALKRYGDELAAGTIVTVEPGRVRVRSITKKNDWSP